MCFVLAGGVVVSDPDTNTIGIARAAVVMHAFFCGTPDFQYRVGIVVSGRVGGPAALACTQVRITARFLTALGLRSGYLNSRKTTPVILIICTIFYTAL